MSSRPLAAGPTNGLCDVAGIEIGHAHDAHVRTGVTVILPDRPVCAAVDVRGGGPGTRETDLLDPCATMDRVDALVLAGGSVYGLEAASAITAALGARGRGFMHRGHCAPIVPAAICFDLANGGDKDWGDAPPYGALGRRALDDADRTAAVGIGAGFGAKAGPLQGGLGMASVAAGDLTVAALAVVNAAGAVTLPGLPHFWAWPFERGREFGGLGPPVDAPDDALNLPDPAPGENTTLVVVATDACLGKAAAKRIAIMAQDGIARAVRPAHTPFDGDLVFTIATGTGPQSSLAETARIGALAADCVARAIARGVYEAVSNGPRPSYRDRYG